MSGLHAATRHIYRSLDKGVGVTVDPAQSNTRIRMKTVRHTVPPTVVAAFTLAQNKLGDGRNIGGGVNWLRQRVHRVWPLFNVWVKV
jgi:hypothetical protein